MDNPPYPLFLSSQTADEAEPENGKFQWNLDNSIVPRNLKSDLLCNSITFKSLCSFQMCMVKHVF